MKRIFMLLVMVTLAACLAGSAGAAPVTVDLIGLFDSPRGAWNHDGIIRLGDTPWRGVDHYEKSNVTRSFGLPEPAAPGGRAAISMEYSGLTTDPDYSKTYFSFGRQDFYLDPSKSSMEWEINSDWLSESGNTMTINVGDNFNLNEAYALYLELFFIGGSELDQALEKIRPLWDLDDFNITAFTLTYEGVDSTGGQPVPLPSALMLLGCGLVGMAGFRRLQR